MTAEAYCAALATMGLSEAQAARLLGVSLSTADRWRRGESRIPKSVAILLRLLAEGRVSLADVES